MVWTLRVSFMLFLAWLIFLVSPFVALYDLAKAVEARDIGRVEQRVNFHAVRISLARQIASGYLKAPDRQEDPGELGLGAAATNAGAALVDPYVEKLVTPQALMEFLTKGWPRAAGPVDVATPRLLTFGADPFKLETLRQAWTLFVSSESQGFRTVIMPLPQDEPKERQFRLTWRLSGTTWRLTGLDLPGALRAELLRRMPPRTE